MTVSKAQASKLMEKMDPDASGQVDNGCRRSLDAGPQEIQANIDFLTGRFPGIQSVVRGL